MEHPIINPPNPYIGSLRVFAGTMVKISGRPRPNATRFAFNFQTGPSLNPRDDLALHLSPCFTPPRVVRNSLRHGAWGPEEAWGNGQIINPHQPFEIIILTEPDQFKIAINGTHYCEFKHRIPYHEITHLSIDGDIDIDRITITSSAAPQQSMSHQPQQPAYGGHHHPSAPAPSGSISAPPYPTGPIGMPMPSVYPTLPSGPQPMHTSGGGVYPGANAYPPPPMPQGPAPTGNSYMSGGYPAPGGPAYPGTPGGSHHYPPPGGPNPTGASYQQQPYPHQQPQAGHSSTSTPFGSIPVGGKALGALAGLGLGAAAGAAALSVVNPIKHLKKMMKPKVFKHNGWGKSSSSSNSSNSSISSRSSFSSNSS